MLKERVERGIVPVLLAEVLVVHHSVGGADVERRKGAECASAAGKKARRHEEGWRREREREGAAAAAVEVVSRQVMWFCTAAGVCKWKEVWMWMWMRR